jgi:hypothetical protein
MSDLNISALHSLSSARAGVLRAPSTADMQQMLDDLERAQSPELAQVHQDRVTLAAAIQPSQVPVQAAVASISRSAGPDRASAHTTDDAHSPETAHSAGAHAAHSHHVPDQDAAHTLLCAHLALEIVEAAGALSGAVIGGIAGASLVGLGLGALGVAHLKHGLKEGEPEAIAEGTGSLLLAARSAANAVALGGESLGSHAMHAVAHTAHGLLTPLGIIHGAIDVGLGAHATIQGVRDKQPLHALGGVLGMGMGTSLLVAAAGGGLPALGVAGALLLAKIGVEGVHKWRHAQSHPEAPQAPPAAPASAHSAAPIAMTPSTQGLPRLASGQGLL